MRSSLWHEEESKLLKRHARKPKKPYVIESRLPNSTIPAFAAWHFNSRYETAARRDQALRELRKNPVHYGWIAIEYRVPEQGTE